MSTYYEIVKKKTIDEVRKIKESDLNTKEKKFKLYQLNKLYQMLKEYNYEHGASVNYDIPNSKDTIQMPVNYGQKVSLPTNHVNDVSSEKENVEQFFQEPSMEISQPVQNNTSSESSDEIIDIDATQDDMQTNITKQLAKYKNEIEEILRPNDIIGSISRVIKPIAVSVLSNNKSFGTSSYTSSSFDNNGNRVIENKEVHNHNGQIRNKHTRTTIDRNGNQIVEDLSKNNYIDVD